MRRRPLRPVPVTNDKLSIAEAAPLLGVSPFTVRAWVRERRVPFYRLGRRIVFSRRELDDFLRLNRVPAREE
jgi:excisionase family DNA binding protein